jgi:hypothetical protein
MAAVANVVVVKTHTHTYCQHNTIMENVYTVLNIHNKLSIVKQLQFLAFSVHLLANKYILPCEMN